MKVGDPVMLMHAWPGIVDKVRKDELLDVALDGGGKAFGMRPEDVTHSSKDEVPEAYDREAEIREEAARERRRAGSDKSWPPKSMETKVPRQSGSK